MKEKQWKLLKKIIQDVTIGMKDCISDLIRFSGVAIDHGITAVKNVMLAGSACF